MRAYLIDEVAPSHMAAIRGYLEENALPSKLERIFWVRIPDDLLNATQYEHCNCQPYVFAVELGREWVKFELFVRSLTTINCACPDYCTSRQRNFVITFANDMLEQLNIRT